MEPVCIDWKINKCKELSEDFPEIPVVTKDKEGIAYRVYTSYWLYGDKRWVVGICRWNNIQTYRNVIFKLLLSYLNLFFLN